MSYLLCGDESTGEQASGWVQALVIIVFVVGAFVLLRFIISQLIACCIYCRGRQNLRGKYGREDGSTFALVTGGSEGLGLELCDQLASQGFNIVMLSRNQQKIDTKIGELKQKYPAVEFKGVAADCSTKTSVAQYKEIVDAELASLDIGIVCLNAGCWVEGPVDLVAESDYEKTFGLNGLHVVYLVKAVLPQLEKRGKKSALMATSSILANLSMPGLASYCATKAFVSNFMESLHFEVRHFLDVTCWEPGPCSTNLFADGTEPPSFVKLTAEKAVRGLLCQLGRARVTNGNFWFHFMAGMLPPTWLAGKNAAKQSRKDFEHARLARVAQQ